MEYMGFGEERPAPSTTSTRTVRSSVGMGIQVNQQHQENSISAIFSVAIGSNAQEKKQHQRQQHDSNNGDDGSHNPNFHDEDVEQQQVTAQQQKGEHQIIIMIFYFHNKMMVLMKQNRRYNKWKIMKESNKIYDA
jgi:hypothetical protein